MKNIPYIDFFLDNELHVVIFCLQTYSGSTVGSMPQGGAAVFNRAPQRPPILRSPPTGHSGTSPQHKDDFLHYGPKESPGRREESSGGSLLKVSKMTTVQRLFLAAGILLVDMVIFFFPLSAVFLAYVILFNPPWVKRFLSRLE